MSYLDQWTWKVLRWQSQAPRPVSNQERIFTGEYTWAFFGKVLEFLCSITKPSPGVMLFLFFFLFQRKAQFTCTAIFLLWGVLVHLVLPPFVFMSQEGWTYIEGLYFSFVTLTTIGFGDMVAGKLKNKYSTSLMILLIKPVKLNHVKTLDSNYCFVCRCRCGTK